MTDRLIVDGNNVMGARPDGWWRDRAGAQRSLIERCAAWAEATGTAVTLVLDGHRPAGAASPAGLDVVWAGSTARDAADDVITALVADAAEPARLRVVTSDAALAARVRAHGAAATGARGFRDALDGR